MIELTRNLVDSYTSHQVRTRFTPVYRGVRASMGLSVELTERVDALLTLFPSAVVGGWTAARLLGVPYSAGFDPTIILPRRRPRPGVVMWHDALPESDVVDMCGGYRCTTPERTAADLARHLPKDEAIAALDQCVRCLRNGRQATTVDRVRQFVDSSRYFHRGAVVYEVLDEVDGRAESPWETQTRLLLHRNRFAMFEPQVVVLGGRYRLDLAAPEYRIAVEYDGAHHRSGEQRARDVERWNALQQDAGWEVIPATKSSVTTGSPILLARVRRALRRRGWDG